MAMGTLGEDIVTGIILKRTVLEFEKGRVCLVSGKEGVGSMPTVTLSSGTELGYLMGPRLTAAEGCNSERPFKNDGVYQ